MKQFQYAALATLCLGCATLSWAYPVTYTFSQTGFTGGGSIDGYFRGTDTDGDGSLYAVGQGFEDIYGFPGGNELDYLEVTLTGFSAIPDPVTLVYDKTVADMSELENFFKGFAYNLDGGTIGDEADEGISFAFPVDGDFFPGFPESTFNYVLGEAFAVGWAPPVLPEPLTSCGDPDEFCSVVFEAVSADNPFGFEPRNDVYSSGNVTLTQVPIGSVVWLMLGGLGAMGASARLHATRS